jgi:hypothetical protein
MERFGQVNGFLELNGPNIHRLENVITMEIGFHTLFDRLTIWLEATVSDQSDRSGRCATKLTQTPSLSSTLTICVPNIHFI